MKRLLLIPLLVTFAPVLTAQDTNWNGGTADWHNAGSWNNGIPDSATNAIITSGDAQITSTDATTRNLTLQDFSTTVTIGGGRTLAVTGNLAFNQSSSFSVGILGGGDLTVAGSTTVRSAQITGGGTATFNGAVSIDPGSSLAIGKNVQTNADTAWTGFDLNISGTTWTNAVGATFTRDHNQGSAGLNFDSNGVFQNNGTFVKSNGGTFDVEAGVTNAVQNGRFTNNGTLRVEGGAMTIHNLNGVNGNVVFENTGTGSIEVSNNSTFELSHGGTLAFTGGNLGGDGTIDADIVSMTGGNLNAGDFAGGTGTAELTISGALEITDTTLNIEIGGTTQGTDFDYLNVAGNTTLNGTTNVVVSFVNGFETSITNGDSFTVLNTAGFPNAPDLGNNITFDFSALNGDFVVAFTGNGGAGSGITLSGFTAVPEPTALTLLGISAAGFVFSRRRRS